MGRRWVHRHKRFNLSQSGLIVSLAAGRAAGFPVRYFIYPGKTYFQIEVQPIIRFSSGKSKSICAEWSGKVPRLCAIWTPQCGGMKGKLCFIKRKSKNLVSNGRIFYRKNVSFFEYRERLNENLWTSCETSLVFSSSSPFWGKRRTFLPAPAVRRFFFRSFVRADGHAPAHRALSEFAIPAFTLHLHSQFIDIVCFAGEGLCLFCLHR